MTWNFTDLYIVYTMVIYTVNIHIYHKIDIIYTK